MAVWKEDPVAVASGKVFQVCPHGISRMVLPLGSRTAVPSLGFSPCYYDGELGLSPAAIHPLTVRSLKTILSQPRTTYIASRPAGQGFANKRIGDTKLLSTPPCNEGSIVISRHHTCSRTPLGDTDSPIGVKLHPARPMWSPNSSARLWYLGFGWHVQCSDKPFYDLH